MSIIPQRVLRDGQKIPQFGLGVWRTPPADTAKIVSFALENGYRHIDTASYYGNEQYVGESVRHSTVAREDIFVTTKLWNDDQGYDKTLRAFDLSFKLLNIDYIDLYLIHWPCPQKNLYVETWKALIALQQEGRVKSIGVSNFRPIDIERLKNETGVIPVVNQIELHPWFPQIELRQFNQQHQIITEAWSPLAQGQDLLQNENILQIAQKYHKTAAQIILRWHIELGNVVFPKSVTPSRILENQAIFDFQLEPLDHQQIAQLNINQRLGFDPATFD